MLKFGFAGDSSVGDDYGGDGFPEVVGFAPGVVGSSSSLALLALGLFRGGDSKVFSLWRTFSFCMHERERENESISDLRLLTFQ